MKNLRIAINGYGRIGRCVLRALFENQHYDIDLIVVNSLGDPKIHAHLTKYDTTHGRFAFDVDYADGKMTIGNQQVIMLNEEDPKNLPWKNLDIDIVLECTGVFASRNKAELHLEAGAKKVLISAPAGQDVDATIVYGVNNHILQANDRIVSNASCTTNCLAPLVKPLHEELGIRSGLMTTIHAYTNDQVLADVYHSDIRRARSATHAMIPTKTGAAAVGLVLPELAGRIDGLAMRIPTINVSVVDLSFISNRKTSVKEVNQILQRAAQGKLKGILHYCNLPLVSVDFNHHSASSIFDATQTKVIGNLVKVLAWYDNEWGFSNRMLDTALAMHQA